MGCCPFEWGNALERTAFLVRRARSSQDFFLTFFKEFLAIDKPAFTKRIRTLQRMLSPHTAFCGPGLS
jgi:hypothetical protein